MANVCMKCSCRYMDFNPKGKCLNCKHHIVYHDISDTININKDLKMFHNISEITKNLYIGSIVTSIDTLQLGEIGITHIINCVSNSTNKWPKYTQIPGIQYLSIDMGSSKTAIIGNYIKKILCFINNAIENNGKILVHCVKGVSRSSSILIAYLMIMENYSFDYAFDLIKKERPICNPNENLINQLRNIDRNYFK